jgi:hypothetical protein
MEGEEQGGKGPAMAKATVQLRCRSAEEARVLWDAVRADDPGSVDGRVDGDLLVITAGPDPMASLRVTLDDVLACLQAAAGASSATTTIEEVG